LQFPSGVLAGFFEEPVALLQQSQHFYIAPHCRADCVAAYKRIPTNWGRDMTIHSLLSHEQITAIKDRFAAVEITDADFNRIEVVGDLIRHIEIVDSWTNSTRMNWPF
jgi:hypothetical protein